MTPAFRLTVAGNDIPLEQRLIELSLTDNAAFDADELQLTLADADQALAIPPKGAKVACHLGWVVDGTPKLVDKGEFTVDETSYQIHPRALTIIARSANFRAGMATVANKSWHNKTLGDIVSAIAKKHDLEAAVGEALAAVVIDHIDQTNESDGHFITRLGIKYDAVANIKNGKLIFTPAGQGTSVSGTNLDPVTIYPAQCTELNVTEADRDSEYTGVLAKWRDTEAGKLVWELAGDKSKAQRLKTYYPTQAEAQDAANAEWQKMQRGKYAAEFALAKGNPTLATETPVTLADVKPSIDAIAWVTTKVTHIVADGGYTTSGSLVQKL